MQTQNRTLLIILIVAALLLCCCCFVVLGGFAGISLFARSAEVTGSEYIAEVTRVVTVMPESNSPAVTATPRRQEAPSATATAAPSTKSAATPQPGITAQPTASGSTERQLAEAKMPERDQRELALRLKGLTDIPVVVNAKPPTLKVGDKQTFWVSNSDTDEHNQVTATLKYLNDHIYMWVDDTAKLSDADLKKSADRFANETYPTNREFFGSELAPGVDNDPRLHILHSRGMGSRVAGYYSSADEYSRLVNPYSNEKRDVLRLGRLRQRQAELDLLRWHVGARVPAHDPLGQRSNEDSWVNEGMSDLASHLNGFDPAGLTPPTCRSRTRN